MSHKIAQARKLGLTGRAADRFGHGGFQSQTTSGQVVGTPPSARKTFRKFETPKTKDKTDSFLNVTKQRNTEKVFQQSLLKSTLDVRRQNAKERREQFSRDLIDSLSLKDVNSIDKLLPPIRIDNDREVNKLIARKALLESRVTLQKQENEQQKLLEAGIMIRPPLPETLTKTGIKEEGVKRIQDARDKVIDEKIDNLQPEIKESIKQEVKNQRLLGEDVSESEIDRLVFKMSPEVNQEVDEYINEFFLERTFSGDEEINKSIAQSAFYNDTKEIELDTPGKEYINALFSRMGFISRDTTFTPEHAKKVAEAELKPFLDGLNAEEGTRVFLETLEKNKVKWEGPNPEDQEREQFRRVWDVWGKALGYSDPIALGHNWIDNEDGKGITQDILGRSGRVPSAFGGVDIKGNLIQTDSVTTLRSETETWGLNLENRALIRTLDLIDPSLIPEGERVEFLEDLRSVIADDQAMRFLNKKVTFEHVLFTFMNPVLGASFFFGELGAEKAGKPIGGQIAVALGKDKEKGELVGEQVFGIIGGLAGGVLGPVAINRISVLTKRALLGYGNPVWFPNLAAEGPSAVLASPINVNLNLYRSRLAQIPGRGVSSTRSRYVVSTIESGLKGGQSRGSIISDLKKVGVTHKEANKAYKLAGQSLETELTNIQRLSALEQVKFFAKESIGRPLNVVKEETEAAASTLQTRATAGEKALKIFGELSAAKDRLIQKAGVAAMRAITGESELIREVRRGATSFTLREETLLQKLSNIRTGVTRAPSLIIKEKEELNRLIELQKLGGGKNAKVINRINELRAIRNKAGNKLKLTKDQDKILDLLEKKKLQSAGSEANLAATEAFVEKSFSVQAKQVILDLAKGVKVSRDRLVRATTNEGVFVKGASNLELQNRLFVAAKESGKQTGRFAGVGAEKSVASTARAVESFNADLRKSEAAIQSFKESPQAIRLDQSIAKYTEILTKKRNWGEVASGISKDAEAAADILEGLPGFSLPELVKGVKATNTQSRLGWALSGKGLPKRIGRAIFGNSIFLDDYEKTGRIIGAGYGREMIVEEIASSRFRMWRYAVEQLSKEAGLDDAKYIGEKARPDFPHSIASKVVRPELYNFTKPQRAVIDMIRQSVDENLAYTERLMGVDTQLFQDILLKQAKGMEGIAGGFSMTKPLGYWPQYLDAKSFEAVIGKKLKSLPFGSDGRGNAYLGKERNYDDIFDLWDALGTGKRPIKLMDPWESMGRRFSASGHAMGDAQYKQAIERAFKPPTKQSNTFSKTADGFQGKFFKPDVAEALNTQNRVLSGHIPNRKLRIAANVIRSFKLSGDLSGAVGIQGMFFLSTVINRPMFMAKHAIPAAKMLVSPKYFDKWYAMNLPEIMRMQAMGLKIATNPVDISRMTAGSLGFKNIHTIPFRVMDTLNDANFGRMVSFYKIETAKQYLEIMRYAKVSPEFAGFAEKIPGISRMLGSLKGVKGLSNQQIEEIVMESVNRRFGGLSQALMGKDANRIFWEQMLDIAPNWLRARVSLYIDAFGPQKGRISQKVLGPERYLAFTMIGRELATAATISTAVSYALTGEIPNLTRPDKFDWLGIRTPIGTIPTIPSVAIMRFFARESKTLFDTVHAVAKGENVGDVLWNTTLAETQTNFGRVLKGRESPALGLILEQATGKDFYGQDITSWDRRVRSLLFGVTPIFIEDTVEANDRTGAFSLDPRHPKLDLDALKEVGAITAVAIGGGSVFPPSPWKVLKGMQDQTAKDMFGELKNPAGDLVYGPEVVFDDLTISDRIKVNNEASIIEQQDVADTKGKELGFESIWLSEEYEANVTELAETGTMNGEEYWSEDLTQAKLNEMIVNGEITDAAYRNMTWNIRRQTSVATKTLRGMQDRPEFEDEAATNSVDLEVDIYYDISLDDFGVDEEGEPNYAKYRDALDAQFKRAVDAATAFSGAESGKRIANLLRPVPEDQAERDFKDSAEIKDNLEDMPKYRFLSNDQSQLVDKYIDMATAISRMAGEVGISVSRKDVLLLFTKIEELDVSVAQVAFLRQIPETKELVWNPDRDKLILDRPYTVRYYSSFYENMGEFNKVKFRNLWGDQFFSDLWLAEEKKELETPEILQGLDLDLGIQGDLGTRTPVGFRPSVRKLGRLGVSTFGELEANE